MRARYRAKKAALREAEEARLAEVRAKAEARKTSLVANWNIAQFLPDEVEKLFHITVSSFLLKPMEFRKELKEEAAADLALKMTGSQMAPSQAAISAASKGAVSDRESNAMAEERFLHYLVSELQTKRLMTLTRDISHKNMTSEDFPMLPGSHLHMTRPALEFVKMVCHVMALDTVVAEPVAKLKENLLRQLHVRPFSDEADFKNPCLSFVLSDVVCAFCGWSRDVDLCRDQHVKGHREDHDLEWFCPQCESPHGRDGIEHRLVKLVQTASAMYQLQDLVCTRCSKVKSDLMSQYCRCSGTFKPEHTPEMFAKSLLPFRSIAKYYAFDWLAETVEECLTVPSQ